MNGNRIYKPTGEYVPERFWNGQVKAQYPNARLINSKIEKQVADLKAELLKEELQDTRITPEVVKKKIKPKVGKKNLFDFCEQLITDWAGKKKESTLEKYTHELSKLKKYAPALQFSDVTPEWLGKYEAYQRNELGNKPNTIWRSFKNLKTFFNAAIKLGATKDYPFDRYENPVYKGGSRPHLTARELAAFIAAIEKVEGADVPAGWYYVFSAYTGLRYSDCMQFRHDKHIIEGKRLLLDMVKTDDQVSVIITPRIQSVLDKIAQYEGKMPTNQECNREIKVIAGKAGIKKPLTFHSARHTFGYSCAEANVPIEITAKLMGHRSTKVTAVYYHISNENADNWMIKLHKA